MLRRTPTSCASTCPATARAPQRCAACSTTSTTRPCCSRRAQPRRPRPRPRCAAPSRRSTTPARRSCSPTRSRATGSRPRGTRRTTRRCSPSPSCTSSPARVGVDPDDPWARPEADIARRPAAGRGPQSGSPGRQHEGAPAPDVPRGPGPHPDRHRAPRRPRSAARCSTSTARRPEVGRARRHGQPRRELVDQPRRLGQQGRRVVGRGPRTTGSPTTRRRSCTGASGRAGQHVELGIAEVNLVGLMGELGATWSRWDQPLLPIGVMYDPFVARALEPWSFGIYAGGQSVLVGTPSGVTLAPEGGAHQSITTPSIGLEQPGVLSVRAGLRARHRVVPARRARPARPAGRVLGLPAAVDPAGRPVAGRRPGRPGRPRAAAPPGRRRAATCCAAPPTPAVTARRDGRGGARGARGRRPAGPRSASPPTSSCVTSAGPAVPARVQARRGLEDASTARCSTQVLPADRAVPDGDRARRAPAHAGVPGRRAPGARPATSASPASGSPATSTASTATTGSTPTSVVGAALDLVD